MFNKDRIISFRVRYDVMDEFAEACLGKRKNGAKHCVLLWKDGWRVLRKREKLISNVNALLEI